MIAWRDDPCGTTSYIHDTSGYTVTGTTNHYYGWGTFEEVEKKKYKKPYLAFVSNKIDIVPTRKVRKIYGKRIHQQRIRC